MNKELYQQVILDHNKSPRNFGTLEDATHGAEGYNPLCGDHIFIDLEIKKEYCDDIRFCGESCAICKSCASILSEEIKNKSVVEAKKILENFNDFILKNENFQKENNFLSKKLKIFQNIWNYPSRIKCVLLPVKTIKTSLENKITEKKQRRKIAKTE